MAVYTSLLEEALEAWDDARQGVIAEVKNLPEKHLSFRPTPHSRTAIELGHHIIEVAAMMVGELTRPDGSFRRQDYPAFIKEYAGRLPRPTSKKMLIDLLRSTHADGDRRFRQAGELLMLQMIQRFDAKLGTRLAWLAHGIAHEEYHRGQLALYARLVGQVPALTKLIMGG